MNRISHVFPDIDALLEDVGPKRPLEGLLVHRASLIEVIGRWLAELHERRRALEGTLAEQDTVVRIKYWEYVLGWVKEHQGRQVVLVDVVEATRR